MIDSVILLGGYKTSKVHERESSQGWIEFALAHTHMHAPDSCATCVGRPHGTSTCINTRSRRTTCT
jgi:hypothetical protein